MTGEWAWRNKCWRVSGQFCCVVLAPFAIIPDVLVGGVDADHSVHGRELEEERTKGREISRGE